MIKIFLALSFIFIYANANIKIATGSKGGTYYSMAKDLQKVLKSEGVSLEVLETSGSKNNISAVKGQTVYKNVDLGIAQHDLFLQMSRRMKKDLGSYVKVVMNLHNEEIHAIVNKNSNITLPNKRPLKVACGLKNSGSCTTSRILSRAYKTRFQEYNIPFKKALGLLKKNKIDMIINVVGKPASYLRNATGIKLIPLNLTRVLKPIYDKGSFSPKDYEWQKKSINTLSVKSVIFSQYNPKKPNDRAITKFLKPVIKNFSKLKSTGHPKWKKVNIKKTLRFSIHPAAKKLIL